MSKILSKCFFLRSICSQVRFWLPVALFKMVGDILRAKFQNYIYKGTFKNYVRSRFPSPLFVLVRFRTPSTHPRYVRFGQNSPSAHPLRPPPSSPLNFYTYEIQRKEISNEYQYLQLNSTCLLRSHSGISIKWTPFVQISALQTAHLKIRSL